jgi:DNA-binding NarL/FixJ family response regulator
MTTQIRVVIADRDKELRHYLGHTLAFDGRFDVIAETDTAKGAFELAFARAADALVIDYSIEDSRDTIFRMKPLSPELKIVALSEGDGAMDQEAITAGVDIVVDRRVGMEPVIAALSDLCDTDWY